jgi:hypothetical protein
MKYVCPLGPGTLSKEACESLQLRMIGATQLVERSCAEMVTALLGGYNRRCELDTEMARLTDIVGRLRHGVVKLQRHYQMQADGQRTIKHIARTEAATAGNEGTRIWPGKTQRQVLKHLGVEQAVAQHQKPKPRRRS